ncbi:MAG: S8 family serine peptidase [Pseudomonadales bacterium]|nr:S8 family serine peptidase [Pseudomonadales bacterium]
MGKWGCLWGTLCVPIFSVPGLAEPNDRYYGNQDALHHVQADAMWSQSLGHGVLVAVLDSGVTFDHSDLENQFVPGRDFIAKTPTSVSNPKIDNVGSSIESGVIDQHGHGTHIAGIVAAIQGNTLGISGVAPGAKILPVRVLDQNKHSQIVKYTNDQPVYIDGQPISSVNAGILYAAGWIDSHADTFPDIKASNKLIINASFGSTSDKSQCSTIKKAIETTSVDVLVVAAVMNEGVQVPYYPAFCTKDPDSQSVKDQIIAVANVATNNQRHTTSNFGDWVSLAAPGVNVLSTWPVAINDASLNPEDNHYKKETGTSMAAAMVSGAAALLWSYCPDFSPAEVKQTLLAHLTPLNSSAGMGSGVLNVQAVYNAVKETPGCQSSLPKSAPSRPTDFRISN